MIKKVSRRAPDHGVYLVFSLSFYPFANETTPIFSFLLCRDYLDLLLWVYPATAFYFTHLYLNKTPFFRELYYKFINRISLHKQDRTMATLTSSPLTPVRVNVRLCGSVPRQEMSSLSLNSDQSAPPVMRTSNDLNKHSPSSDLKNNGSSESWDSLEGSTHHTIEDTNCVAALLCSQLLNMQHHEEQPQAMQPLQRRISPTFEPPTWAVPATGESRLEVSI